MVGSGHKLEPTRFCLTIRQLFCVVQVMEHWHRLPKEVMESPPWRSCKICGDVGLGPLPWVGQMDPEVPSNLSHSVITAGRKLVQPRRAGC